MNARNAIKCALDITKLIKKRGFGGLIGAWRSSLLAFEQMNVIIVQDTNSNKSVIGSEPVEPQVTYTELTIVCTYQAPEARLRVMPDVQHTEHQPHFHFERQSGRHF